VHRFRKFAVSVHPFK